MLARLRKAQENDESGFTLIELLVVIIIIGILAAIAIPTFLKQREKGWLAAVKSDVKNAVTAEESYATDNNGSYFSGTHTTAALTTEGFNGSSDVTLVMTASGTANTVLKICGDHGKLTNKSVLFENGQTTVKNTENCA